MSQELDLRDYSRIILKRAWLIALIVTFVCSLVGWHSIFVKKPMYEASTKIVVTQLPTQFVASQLDLNEINMNIQLIDTYKEVIKTPAILDQVVADYPQFQLTAEAMSGMVNVSSVNNTQVMTVVVRNSSYVRAAEIANAISVVFQKEIPSIFNVQNVSILNKAKTHPTGTPQPVGRNAKQNVMIAFMVSLMIGVGISFLLEYLDDTIKTEDDVKEWLDMPTLAMITHTSADTRTSGISRSRTHVSSKRGGEDHFTI
jgi:capsular polysaccharide biosynthesis protein